MDSISVFVILQLFNLYQTINNEDFIPIGGKRIDKIDSKIADDIQSFFEEIEEMKHFGRKFEPAPYIEEVGKDTVSLMSDIDGIDVSKKIIVDETRGEPNTKFNVR